MGLDMYLTAEQYIGGQYDFRGVVGRINIHDKDGEIINTDDMSDVGMIVFQVAYWRKVNAVHNWFVENTQHGIDECQKTYVSREQLQDLIDECNKALRSKDPSALKPRSGFFFGSTEIDEWYWKDIRETVRMLSNALNSPRYSNCYFYYQSSW